MYCKARNIQSEAENHIKVLEEISNGREGVNMDEKDINRELDEMRVMLKTLENKFLSNTSEKYVSISDICDIFAIHLAVLRAYYDMSEALEFIQRLYTGGGNEE